MVLLDEADGLLIGEAAALRAAGAPSRVAREFKRRVGDPVPILVGGAPMAAELLMARMLSWVVDHVTATEGAPPDDLAVTHPASWGPYKLDLFRQAIHQIGLQVTHVIPEPVAAASFYATQRPLAVGSLVGVYDLGGGTLDTAVVRVDDAGFTVVGQPEGIERLGGVDFDHAVLGHVTRALGIDLDTLDGPEWSAAVATLRRDCVVAKEALSVETDVAVPVMLPGRHTQVRLTRAELEAMIRPKLDEAVQALRRAIASADVSPEDLAAVLLVGGSSRIPLVAQLVGALGRPIVVDARPKDTIPLGAALLAAGAALPRADVATESGEGGDRDVVVDTVGPPPGLAPRPGRSDDPATSTRSRVLVAGAVGAVALVAAAAVLVPRRAGDEPERPAPYDPVAHGPIGDNFQLDGAELTLGWKDQLEAELVGEITRHALEAAGATVTTRTAPVTSDVLHDDLVRGEVDLYWDYLVDVWRQSLDQTGDAAADPAVLRRDLNELDASNDVAWLAPTAFDANYTLVVRSETARDLALSTLSDLGAALADDTDLSLCATQDPGRLVSAIEEGYDVRLPAWRQVDVADLGIQVDTGDCTFGVAPATWEGIEPLGLVPLEDDRGELGASNAAPGVRSSALDDHPGIERLLAAVARGLDDRTMRELNARAGLGGEAPASVAQEWLRRQGFLDDAATATATPIADTYDLSGASLRIGALDNPQGRVLGELTRLALEEARAQVHVEIHPGGSGAARQALRAGELDLYWEALSTAWIEHLGHMTTDTDLDTLYRRVREEDAAQGIAWLEPAAFDRSWAVVATSETAIEQDVDAIGDLADVARRADDPGTTFMCGLINDVPRRWIEHTHDVELPSYRVVDSDVEGRVDSGECRFGVVRAWSPWLDSLDLVLLRDDGDAMPDDGLAVAASAGITAQHPQLGELVGVLGQAVDGDAIRGMTARVAVDGVAPEVAARDWLRESGFLRS